MQVTLNGGNYGGTVLDVPENTDLIVIQSSVGDFWLYDYALNSGTVTAEFTGMVGADYTPPGAGLIVRLDLQTA
jgi:hypothetical protein